jgi:hypothetical protein
MRGNASAGNFCNNKIFDNNWSQIAKSTSKIEAFRKTFMTEEKNTFAGYSKNQTFGKEFGSAHRYIDHSISALGYPNHPREGVV